MEETGLHKHLYDHQSNRDNLNSLLDEYNPEKFIAFIGSGINASLRDIPDNEGLYKKLCEKYSFSEDNSIVGPDSFSKLYVNCNDKGNFDKHVFEIVKPKDTSGPMTSIEIVRAFNCFVTTNYHEPIESAFKTKQAIAKAEPKELKIYYFAFPGILGCRWESTLTYLHGNSMLGFCVLRKKDYEYYYPSIYGNNEGVYVVENSLASLLTDYRLVFLGCSLEEHLQRFLSYFKSKLETENRIKSDVTLKKNVKIHYWVTTDSEISLFLKDVPKEKHPDFEQSYFDKYAKINIKPIIYKGEHKFLEELCKTIASLNDSKRIPILEKKFNP